MKLQSMLLFTSMSIAGCSPDYGHLDFTQRTSPPLPVFLGSERVMIPAGIAVAVSPRAIDDGGDLMEDSQVQLLSTNESVLGLDPTPDDRLVLYGVRPGQASITVFLDGDEVDSIPVVVTSQ